MNTKIIIIALLALSFLAFFGCIENNQQNENNEETILSEIDSTWIDETDLSIENPIESQDDAIAAETGTEIIDENQEISIGEMI